MKIEEVVKQPGFEDNYERVIVNLLYSGNWIRDEEIRTLKGYDILPQHYNVLRIINGKYPKPICPGEIKEVMIDKANDLTRLIDKLVKNGWVKRELCATNRRKMDVTLTSEGKAILKKMNNSVVKLSKEIKERLSVKEAAQLSDLLDKIRG